MENGSQTNVGDHRNGSEMNLVDTRRLADLEESLGDGLGDVIDTYLEDAPRLIDEIEAAGRRSDLDNVHRLAHSLKSSSGIFGARALAALCYEIEQRVAGGQPVGEEDIQALRAAFQKLRSVLNSYRPNP